MKLLLTIIRDSDNEQVSQALVGAGIRVTRIASTGGFMRRGSTTLLIGIDSEKVDDAISIIKGNLSPVSDPGSNRATLFLIDVEHFSQV